MPDNNGADGQILLSLKMAETLALIQSQLNQISKNLDLQITGKLNKSTTKAQLKSDLASMKVSQKVNLTGKLDKSQTKAQLKSDIGTLSKQPVQLQAKINMADVQKQIQKANIQLDTNVDGNEELKEVGYSLDSINKKSAATVASIMTLREAFTYLQRAAKQMIETAASLDKQLTDLRMATGESYEETSRLVNDYTQLAKSLGATSSQIIEAADDWLRQGKTIAETNTLISDSWKLSAVSELDAATSTEYLTSVMKAYKIAVDDVIGIVDKVTSVDLVSATNAGGLMEAMNRTATTANMAGVSIDKLLGYVAAMGEVTGRSMSSVGESLKTIFSRMSDIKANKLELIDEDGTTELLSDVELTLKNVGIDLRETVNEYNDYEDVLDALASKWNTLSEIQQNALTKAFAGTRQQDMFRILMENYDTASKYAETAMNSAGAATEKFNAYLESVQAHYNSLVASAEALAKQTVPASLMNGIMDAASAVLDFLTATNLLTIALSSLTAALSVKGLEVFGSKIKSIYQSVTNLSAAFNILSKSANVDLSADEFQKLLTLTKGLNAQQLKLIVSSKNLTNQQRMQILMASGLTEQEAAQTLVTMGLATAEGTATAATFSLSGAFKALTAAIAANPIGFLVVALTTAVSIISTVNNKIEETRQKTIEAGNAAAEEGQELLDLVSSYFELADAVDAGTASKEDMIAAQDDVIKALGLEGQSVDELIAKYGSLRNAILETTAEQLKTDISLAISGANTAKKDAVSELETYLGTSISGGSADIYQYLKDQGFSGISVGTKSGTLSLPNADYWDAFSNPTFEQLKENRDYLEAAMNAVREEFGSDSALFEQLSEAYTRYSDAIDPAIEAIDNSNKLIAEYWKIAESAINNPKTQEEFDAFRQSIIDKVNSDLDWNDDGSYTAAGLVDSLLSADRTYAQFYDGLVDTTNDGLDAVEDAIQSHGNSIKGKLEELWNSESFSDTQKSIVEMANALDGITADNIETLAESSEELAALLDEDGMSAKFLAHVLQTEVTSGNGFELITDDALTLNSALEGLKGRFDEVTDAKSRYDAALAGGEKDDNFKSYAEAMEALNEQFVAGTTNSNAFWAAAEFLFGTEQLDAWGWSAGLDEIYAAMERNVGIFGDAESAGQGFLDRLYEISEAGQITADDGSVIAQIEKLSDGTYNLDFDTADLDALADKLGITSEAAMACMQALSMYGDFNFYDIEAVMDAVQEIGLSSEALNGTAVNVGALTDQLISLGYTNKDVHDLMLVLQEVDGVSLLDVNANVDTLTQSLSDLGLAAQDGVNVTVNADGLADLMSQLNFTKEDTQNLITKLGEADGITLTNAEGEVISLNDALEYTDELTFASVTSELDGITDSAEMAQREVQNLQVSINKLTGKTVTVTLDVQRKSGILGSIFGYAKGTDGAPEGDALVGEEGEELVQSGNRAYFVGTNGPEITHLNEGDIVYTAAETRKIKRGATVIRGVVPAFAGGTGLGKSNKTYESVLPSTSTGKSTSSSSSSSSTSKAESEFERLYKYHQHLLNMDQESVADYIAWLDKAYQEAYKNGEIELDDYYKYQEEVFDKVKSMLDDVREEHENAITLTQNWLDNAIADGDRGKITQYTSEIVAHYKAMQEELHKEAEYYRSLGYSDTSDEVSKLSDLWWDYYDKIKTVSADAWQQVVDNANDALDSVTDLYDTLKDAAQEYAENGSISVKTLQSIYKLGVQNLAYLEDENGQLVINEENIQKVIAARTQQMAIETALNYIQQLRTALTNEDTAALQNLIFATDVAANSTWDLVYAQLQLLGLEDTQYNAALQRINTLRSLADVAVTSIGRIDNSAKEALQNTSDALDDILQYVKDMIKQEVENQVEALEDQIDRYREIVDLQKKSLDLEREKDNYTKSVTEKTKAIAELQARIARLDLDDSREAQAEKAKLMEELADLNNDLAETQADHAYEVNSDALDAMADAYEKEKRNEIEILEDTISSEEKLYQLAIQRINNEWDTLYQDLINWNYQYGSSTESELVSAWNAASQAVQQYGSYLNAVATTQSQLSAIDNASSSNVIGTMGDYDTSGGATMSRVKEIVAQMKANSIQHGSEDDAGKLRLNKENLRLGEELQGLIGRTVVRGDDGVWYLDKVGGAQLYATYPYSTYHTGGIVGDEPTAKQDEMFALLKKREAVFTEPQQETIYRVLKEDETVAGKLGISGLYNNMNGSIYAEMQSQNAIKRDAQQAQSTVTGAQQNFNIENHVPVQVMVTEKLDKKDLKRLSREIGDIASQEIYESFVRGGTTTMKGRMLRPK